jgi:glycine/D-amino acid oxidase-like deaminating enzyme
MRKGSYDRVVIGGGLFGSYSALILGKMGHSVLLVEQASELMGRASLVNQARLHTGLHYPRSIVTARESLQYYEKFRERFPSAIFDFQQIYAISRHNSKTTPDDFKAFVSRLGLDFELVEPDRYFNPGTIELAFKVEEPTFDAQILRLQILKEIQSEPNIELHLNTAVIEGRLTDKKTFLSMSNDSKIETDGVVIATYAGINSTRHSLGLPKLPLSFELAEIILGTVIPEMSGIGFTVMDGPFWSIMPFGDSGYVSLTSVGITPLRKSQHLPIFDCQSLRNGCTPFSLSDCNTCHVRPSSGLAHHLQQMKLFLKNQDFFTPINSLMTVKSTLNTTHVDDARPTLIQKEPESNTWTIFSGKVSTLFDLEGALN